MCITSFVFIIFITNKLPVNDYNFLVTNLEETPVCQLILIQHHYLPLNLTFLMCYEITKSAGLILTEEVLTERMDLQSCRYRSFK